VGVGDIGAMHDLVRRERKCKADVDGRGAGRINDAGMDGRPGSDFYGSWKQRRRDRISISDGAWIRAGAYNADDDGTSWADGMRGDGVGVRDVGAVYDGRTGSERHCHNCGDGRTARRVNEYGGVDGQWNDERHNTQQHWRDGIDVGDGAWIRAGAGGADRHGPGRADRVRGDGVGVGDIGAVHDGRPGDARHRRCCADGRGAGREHDGGILDGRREHERGISQQCGGVRLGVGDGAWIRAGTGGADGDGTSRADRMRVDRVGVGDVDAMQCSKARCG
jgi:hypothetical protein